VRNRGRQRQNDGWTRQSGPVVSWQVGDPKPEIPSGKPASRRRKRNPKADDYQAEALPRAPRPGASSSDPPTGPPVSDEVGLANIRKMARLYRLQSD
jgi:hypothetical protein